MMDADLRAELRETVDDVWAEGIRHLPLTAGRPDAVRAVTEVMGVIRTGERDTEAVTYGRGNGARAGVAAVGGYLRIDRAAHPDLQIRKGDKIVAVDRGGQPVFEVQLVDDRSHLRLICHLGDAS